MFAANVILKCSLQGNKQSMTWKAGLELYWRIQLIILINNREEGTNRQTRRYEMVPFQVPWTWHLKKVQKLEAQLVSLDSKPNGKYLAEWIFIQEILIHQQGLKSIGNAGTTFPGRQTPGRKVGVFTMNIQEFIRDLKPHWKIIQLWFYFYLK